MDSNLPAPRLVAECCSSSDLPSCPGAAAGSDAEDPAAAAAAAAESVSTACQAADSTEPAAGSAVDGTGEQLDAAGAATSDHHAADQGVQRAAEAAAVAADEAAVRRFLAEHVQRHDAKVFVVMDCPLESHPLQDSPGDAAAAEG